MNADELLEHFRSLETNDLTFQQARKLFERPLIVAALERTRWNKSKAALVLGISSRTLYERMETYDIHADGRCIRNKRKVICDGQSGRQ